MKRFFTILFASAAIMAASTTASAQYFDHVSLGVGVGLDGVSLQAAAPIGSILQLRLGGSYMPPIGYSFTAKNIEFQPGETIDLDLRAQACMRAFNAMLDLFPGKETTFRFSFGMFAGPGTLVTLFNTKPYLEESEWGNEGIQIGDTFISTDDKGISRINADVAKVMPYFGIGAGRAVNANKAVSFCFDLGVCYSGGIGIWTHGTNTKTWKDDYIRITSTDIKNFGGDDMGIIDKLGNIPVLPLMKFSLFFRLF